jgi:hypothetical protein
VKTILEEMLGTVQLAPLTVEQYEVYDSPSPEDERYRKSAALSGAASVAIAVGATKKYVVVKARDLLP